MIEITQKLQFTNGPRGRRRICARARATADAQTGRVPRIARLMALAIRFDGLLRDGIVADQSDLARLANVTQPRMTQIMNLLHLAPDIQEELLFLSAAKSGRDPSCSRPERRNNRERGGVLVPVSQRCDSAAVFV